MIFLRWDAVGGYLQNQVVGMTLSVMKHSIRIYPDGTPASTLRRQHEFEEIERKLK